MKVQFHIRASLPEGMGKPVLSEAIASIIGPEIRDILEEETYYDVELDDILPRLRALLGNELINGVQVTLEKYR